jgi:hypothetical protein
LLPKALVKLKRHAAILIRKITSNFIDLAIVSIRPDGNGCIYVVTRVYGGWGQWQSLNKIRRGRGGGRNSGDAMIFGDRFSCC